jgi:hypothetical protein
MFEDKKDAVDEESQESDQAIENNSDWEDYSVGSEEDHSCHDEL